MTAANSVKKKVEIFIGPIACTCAGGPTPAKQEAISRVFALKRALEKELVNDFELTLYNLQDSSSYEVGIRRLKELLERKGEKERAARAGFLINMLTPAIAVDGDIIAIGECPSLEDFSARFGADC